MASVQTAHQQGKFTRRNFATRVYEPIADTMNLSPYDPPSNLQQERSTTKRPVTKRPVTALIAAIATAFIAIPVIGPGLVALAMELGSRGQSTARYATYDREVLILGVILTPTTAYLVALLFGAILLAFWVHCVRVWLRGAWREN